MMGCIRPIETSSGSFPTTRRHLLRRFRNGRRRKNYLLLSQKSGTESIGLTYCSIPKYWCHMKETRLMGRRPGLSSAVPAGPDLAAMVVLTQPLRAFYVFT
jgi:hypothetical protein